MIKIILCVIALAVVLSLPLRPSRIPISDGAKAKIGVAILTVVNALIVFIPTQIICRIALLALWAIIELPFAILKNIDWRCVARQIQLDWDAWAKYATASPIKSAAKGWERLKMLWLKEEDICDD